MGIGDRPAAGPNDARPACRGAIAVGIGVIAVFFGGLGAWAALAPLDSAAIAPGVVKVEGQRKTVQHLEGGIVDRIFVREGDSVSRGDLLIRLDDTQQQATLRLLDGRLLAAKALEARLAARRDGLETIDFPAELETGDAEAARITDGQRMIFSAQNRTLATRISILEQRIAALREEIVGLQGQIAAQDRQLVLIEEEAQGLRGLFNKGLARKERILALERTAAEIDGGRSRNSAEIARARQAIGGARLEIDELSTTMVDEAVAELRETQKEIFDVEQRIVAIKDIISRTDIRAPLSGTVVGLRVHSARGVIAPGEPLLDIVPADKGLVVEAQVSPADIDMVHAGQPARVRLTAFNSRQVAPVRGVVRSVSADRLTDERTGVSYFLARVRVTDDVEKALNGAALLPGMPAQVTILAERRTPLDYLTSPITRSLQRSMREH